MREKFQRVQTRERVVVVSTYGGHFCLAQQAVPTKGPLRTGSGRSVVRSPTGGSSPDRKEGGVECHPGAFDSVGRHANTHFSALSRTRVVFDSKQVLRAPTSPSNVQARFTIQSYAKRRNPSFENVTSSRLFLPNRLDVQCGTEADVDARHGPWSTSANTRSRAHGKPEDTTNQTGTPTHPRERRSRRTR